MIIKLMLQVVNHQYQVHHFCLQVVYKKNKLLHSAIGIIISYAVLYLIVLVFHINNNPVLNQYI